MSVPNHLHSRPIWVCHRNKMPFDAKNGMPAKANDPSTWSDYKTAEKAYWKYGYDGISVALGSRLNSIDLDSCYDYKFTKQAQDIIDRIPSYKEWSPSGTGIHLMFLADIETSRRKEGIEWYASNRFMSFTGMRLENSPYDIPDASREAEQLFRELFPAPIAKRQEPRYYGKQRSDEQALEIARRNPKFVELYEQGDLTAHRGDWSAADLALMNYLRNATLGNREQMDRLFRDSALMREKFDRKHGSKSYGEMTIERSIGY